ncbi:MAG: hypothetical protein QM791_22260 [Ferruginibacter sp.]
MIKQLLIVVLCFYVNIAAAQDATTLLQKVKAKIEKVDNYEASGNMKTNVSFLKVPEAQVKIYFKKPNQLKIKNEKGISFVPKGAMSINLNNIVAGNQYSVIDAGSDKIGSATVRVIKLLPNDDNAEVVLSTLYIDEKNEVILKAKTTTRENGSFQLEMSYGNYISYGLPDKVIFTFNTKDYKLPKGVTFDFDDGEAAKKATDKTKNNTGRAEITYNSYTINKGIPESVFK